MDCEDFDNPADFFLDKVVEVEKKLRAPDQYYNSGVCVCVGACMRAYVCV